jgi:hypothetical protein
MHDPKQMKRAKVKNRASPLGEVLLFYVDMVLRLDGLRSLKRVPPHQNGVHYAQASSVKAALSRPAH